MDMWVIYLGRGCGHSCDQIWDKIENPALSFVFTLDDLELIIKDDVKFFIECCLSLKTK